MRNRPGSRPHRPVVFRAVLDRRQGNRGSLSAAGPVTVSGAQGNAVGSQTVEAGNDAVVGGRDAASTTTGPHAARAG